MKRSASVRLTLMGAAAVATGGLAGCSDDVTHPGNYPSVDSCAAAGNKSSACRSAYDSAVATHEQRAPRFATKEECLKGVDVNDCYQARLRQPDGSFVNMFVPAMAGFAIAQAIQQRQSGGGTYMSYGGSPYYGSRDYSGQYRDMDNMRTSRSTTTFSGSSTPSPITTSRPPNVSSTTIARSGFGSSSSFGHSGSS